MPLFLRPPSPPPTPAASAPVCDAMDITGDVPDHPDDVLGRVLHS